MQVSRSGIVSSRLGAGYVALAVTAFLAVCLHRWPPSALQYDLRVYVISAAAYLDGSDLYSAHLAYPDDIAMGFTYPPFAIIGFLPFALAGTGTGRVLMVLVCGVSTLLIGLLTVRALRPLWPRQLVVAVALVVSAVALFFEPVTATFGYGQINLVLAAMLLIDLFGRLPRRYRGALVGIATGIKLTPGIFILFLLVTRRYREAGTAAMATATTVLIGCLIAPGSSARFWGGLIFDPNRPGAAHFISNQSLRGVVARLAGAPPGLLAVVVAAAVAVLGLFAARRAHEAGEQVEAVLLAAATGLLVSPVSWTGHWVWALPICALLWSRATTSPGAAVAALGWTATMTLGLPWRTPYFGDLEYTHQGFDLLAGNSYAIAALAFLLAGLLRHVPRPHQVGSQVESRLRTPATRQLAGRP